MSLCVVIVEFVIRKSDVAAFHDLILINARTSLKEEPGCLQFDVVLPEDATDRVVLYEIYQDRAAFDLHAVSAHYATFAAAAGDFVIRKDVTIGKPLDAAIQGSGL